MTLDEAKLDAAVRILGMPSVDEDEKARLSALGLRAGVMVTKIVPSPLQDPVECLVGSQLLALERRLLRRIEVAPA